MVVGEGEGLWGVGVSSRSAKESKHESKTRLTCVILIIGYVYTVSSIPERVPLICTIFRDDCIPGEEENKPRGLEVGVGNPCDVAIDAVSTRRPKPPPRTEFAR